MPTDYLEKLHLVITSVRVSCIISAGHEPTTQFILSIVCTQKTQLLDTAGCRYRHYDL